MRSLRNPQMTFGEVDIAAIKFDPKSRDDIPPILRGLQYIYTTPEIRAAVFKILAQVIPPRAGKGLTEKQRHQTADCRLERPGEDVNHPETNAHDGKLLEDQVVAHPARFKRATF